MDSKLEQYKRITIRRNVINLKKQIKYSVFILLGSVVVAHLITFSIIYLAL